MYRYIYTINGREYDELSSFKDDISNLVEMNIRDDEVGLFYSDHKDFMDNVVKIYLIEKVKKNLYLVDTDVTGYDTYAGGVFCAYSEKQSLEFAVARMGYASSSKKIGVADDNLELGSVITSFRAG